MGLVIDNSGSMRDKRPQVNAAALTLVKTSNPQDEAFVVNFNDDFYLDTIHDFTNDITEMKDALERIDARGSTALYDAVIGSLDHLKKGAKDKKVLLVVTDGVDNASRRTLDNAVQEAQRSDALIYAIGIFSDDDIKHNRGDMKKARRALTELATSTGGLAFFPENVDGHRIHLHADRPRYSQSVHRGLLPHQRGPGRHLSATVQVGVAPQTRLRKASGAHPHRLLRSRPRRRRAPPATDDPTRIVIPSEHPNGPHYQRAVIPKGVGFGTESRHSFTRILSRGRIEQLSSCVKELSPCSSAQPKFS